MLDIKFIREHIEAVKADLKKRNDSEKLGWLGDLIKKGKEYRLLLQDNQALRASRNFITEAINHLKKAGKDIKAKIKEIKELPEKIKKSDELLQQSKEKIDFYLMRLPNILHESVPVGKDPSENKIIKTFGKAEKPSFDLIAHGELLQSEGMANFDKAAEVSGHGKVCHAFALQ